MSGHHNHQVTHIRSTDEEEQSGEHTYCNKQQHNGDSTRHATHSSVEVVHKQTRMSVMRTHKDEVHGMVAMRAHKDEVHGMVASPVKVIEI